MHGAGAQIVAVALLLAVVATASLRPRGLPEAVAAVPAAVLVVLLGLLPVGDAWREVTRLAPTVVFLAALLVVASLCGQSGLFDALGAVIARRAAGRPVRLLVAVFAVAAVVTALLSLDATVVLLTPVALACATRAGVRPRPHLYACAHLANSASLLLPTSNLTNLLAFRATGTTFTRFAAVMALPWLVAIGLEYVAHRWWFRRDLAVRSAPVADAEPRPIPIGPLVVVAAMLCGFALASARGVDPAWIATGGALALWAVVSRRRPVAWRMLAGAANPGFCTFVLALAVVVAAAVHGGLGAGLAAVSPNGTTLLALLATAALAAVLANLVNNLPAVLVLVPVVAGTGPAAVFAVLLGVNLGPNLTYVGSLATLL